jgi:hypothetical protein
MGVYLGHIVNDIEAHFLASHIKGQGQHVIDTQAIENCHFDRASVKINFLCVYSTHAEHRNGQWKS